MSNEWLILFFLVGAIFVGASTDLFRNCGSQIVQIPKNLILTNAEYLLRELPGLQFNVGYYLFAILFLVFDVETVLVFPWAVVMKEVGMAAFIEIVIFFFILGLGLLYAWKKHALIWE